MTFASYDIKEASDPLLTHSIRVIKNDQYVIKINYKRGDDVNDDVCKTSNYITMKNNTD